tara:strand:- start:430 stop:546 length:117 start_codon:yes stop_codon:yes gene_type:complete
MRTTTTTDKTPKQIQVVAVVVAVIQWVRVEMVAQESSY